MNGRTIAHTAPTVLDTAELILDVPRRERRDPARPEAERARKREDVLVPDSGPRDDLVPDSWGGVDLA